MDDPRRMTAGERLRWMQRRGLAPLPQQPLRARAAHYQRSRGDGGSYGYGYARGSGNGDGHGYGNGYGYGDGYGDGWGSGYGDGNGDGNGGGDD